MERTPSVTKSTQMPTYEYRCPSCSADFEKFQRMSDTPAAECPGCGAAAERRISGGAGFLFRGDGFYITDYRSEGYKKAAESDRSSEGAGKDAGKDATSPKDASTTKAESSGTKSDATPASTKSDAASKPAPKPSPKGE